MIYKKLYGVEIVKCVPYATHLAWHYSRKWFKSEYFNSKLCPDIRVSIKHVIYARSRLTPRNN